MTIFEHTFKPRLKKLFLNLGINVNRLSLLTSPSHRSSVLLRTLGISTVFDVGANTGQFALALREQGYQGIIISFEPISTAHESLLLNSQHDPNWIVHSPMALSDHSGRATINISGNSMSSSLQNMLPIHLSSAPASKYIGQETISLDTFDNVFAHYEKLNNIVASACMLKIDTQGHEFLVLKGCNSCLSKISSVLLELSVESMYENEKDMLFILNWLDKRGFKLWSIDPSFADTSTGRILQYDGLFVNSLLVSPSFSTE